MDIPLLDSASVERTDNVEIVFKDVKYTLYKGEGPKKEKPILKSVSGVIYPGRVSAIFGPTGEFSH